MFYPTRGDIIFDLLLTTHPDLVPSIQVIESLPGCDHDDVRFSLAAMIPKQSAFKCLLYNYKATNLNDLKEVFSRDVVDFDADDIKLPWLQWKDLFFSAVT